MSFSLELQEDPDPQQIQDGPVQGREGIRQARATAAFGEQDEGLSEQWARRQDMPAKGCLSWLREGANKGSQHPRDVHCVSPDLSPGDRRVLAAGPAGEPGVHGPPGLHVGFSVCISLDRWALCCVAGPLLQATGLPGPGLGVVRAEGGLESVWGRPLSGQPVPSIH